MGRTRVGRSVRAQPARSQCFEQQRGAAVGRRARLALRKSRGRFARRSGHERRRIRELFRAQVLVGEESRAIEGRSCLV